MTHYRFIITAIWVTCFSFLAGVFLSVFAVTVLVVISLFVLLWAAELGKTWRPAIYVAIWIAGISLTSLAFNGGYLAIGDFIAHYVLRPGVIAGFAFFPLIGDHHDPI